MHYHSQNLSDGRRSKFWNGRSWLHLGKPYKSRVIHWEWGFGKWARNFSATVTFGNGDSDDGVLFHLCLPWLFFIFIGIDRLIRCKECEVGVKIHDNGLWLKTFSYCNEWSHDDSWWRQGLHWSFPWDLKHHDTWIMEHGKLDEHLRAVWREGGRTYMDCHKEREMAIQRQSVDYPYSYILKNRNVQNRIAMVHVVRMEWRARWWPIIPRRKVSTSIEVRFDQEVGEETGSWKGGCTGCGYEMKWGETPERTLSRMEHEREFRR